MLHALALAGAFDKGLAIRTMCLPDRFIDQASPAEMYEDAGLSVTDIVATARGALGTGGEVVPLTLAR